MAECVECGERLRAQRKRAFRDRLEIEYVICDCGKANRKPARVRGRDLRRIAQFDKLRVAIAGTPKFDVLVWGPTPKSSEKRAQIREAIVRKGHKAAYSEDLSADDPTVPGSIQELFQTKGRFVVNFGHTQGPQGEAHDFARLMGRRMLLWLPDGARKAYTGSGLGKELRTLGAPPEYYRDEDVESCVIALASADWVETLSGMSYGFKLRAEMAASEDPANWVN